MSLVKGIEDKLEILELFPEVKNNNKNIDYLYIAGSIMEGFGNESSDVDVFVISEEPEKLLNNHKRHAREATMKVGESLIKNIVINDVRYDFEYYSSSHFHTIINELNSLNFNTDEHISRLPADDVDLLHRLKFASPLLHEETFKTMKEEINFENLNKYIVVTTIEKYDGYLEDLEGALSSNDLGTAYVVVKLLLKNAVNAYLASVGETNPGEKWIYRKLLRYTTENPEGDLLKLFLQLDSYPFSEETIKEYAFNVVNFTQGLIMKAQIILK
ncbi:hypothetical protein AS034_16130 [[Bacillus] enclensis]|uniref:Nucleotidyltransferase domain-containing protein n=1 Tax=[Bacillus] enclensis TaxID=1402860 RepID=A0A0V8HDJ1_9BACI|nr:nucleotidyltransferase domain-containing protein [[Bacillus] enclensis]KSU60369.1 hypothetical protein AS034_16130 [[Bacillus] enclensis]SCC23736.1 Nucleotidyltransferase domain-containing protein [[Bacillus] enclensis]